MLDPKFPADDAEELVQDLMSATCDEFEQHYEWDWPKLKNALQRWIAAEDEGLDNAAVEQEHEEPPE